MAKRIDAQLSKDNRNTTVITLQESTEENHPIHFIHAQSFEVQLAKAMGSRRAILGVEVPWPLAWRPAALNNETAAMPSMEEYVKPYTRALIAHSRSCPRVLVGYSFAGLMAAEAAYQLQKHGKQVEMVVLIDSAARFPGKHQKAWTRLRQDWDEARKMLAGGLSSHSIGRRLNTLRGSVTWMLAVEMKRLLRFTKWVSQDKILAMLGLQNRNLGDVIGFRDEEGILIEWGLMLRVYRNAMKNYNPPRLDCRGILFRSEPEKGERSCHVNDTLGWENVFANGLEIIPLNSDHHFRGQIDVIATAINRVLDRH